MQFELKKKKETGIRVGEIRTAHGVIHTPFFMPVATVGSVKGVSPDELRHLGAEIVLSNTYHLYLRPGEELIKNMGGLQSFMRWDGPILTDSGGYQVFSLGRGKNGKSLVKITEDGVEFTSHIDGSKHFFTPEKVIDIQLDLGVDILMPLDVCPSGKASRAEIQEAVRLTIVWAKRAKKHFMNRTKKLDPKNWPALFGIVQGGLDKDLRKFCAKELIDLDFDGYSIGGLAVDHETRDMWGTVKLMGEILPEKKPRYLMGVGTPDDIVKAMKLGVDMFDCVLPTRLARHGSVYIKNQKSKVKNYEGSFRLINLLNSKYRNDGGVIEENCSCPACSGGFSRAYISHLIRNNEILGMRLASMHNLYVYLELVREARI